MDDDTRVTTVLAAMAAAWGDGCPVARPNRDVASVAMRRWLSSDRRGVDQHDRDARVADLAKGLIAYAEADRGLVGPLKQDYLYLATTIAAHLAPA